MTAIVRTAFCLLVLFLISCGGNGEATKAPPTIETEDDKIYYALGLVIGKNMGAYAGNLTEAQLAEAKLGLADAAMQREPRVTIQDYGTRLSTMGKKYQQAATDSSIVLEAVSTAPLTEDEKNLYYAFGLAIGGSLASFAGNLTDLQLGMVTLGFADLAMKRSEQVDMQEYGPKLNALSTKIQEAVLAEQKERGSAYLANAATEEGAVTTDSGIVYKELTAGSGAQVQTSDRVNVHYTGTLVDGTKFDSSRDRGEPITFGLGQVIQGWKEGLTLMKIGGRGILVIPSDLAYGDAGRPGIPPGATLIFDIEVLGVE